MTVEQVKKSIVEQVFALQGLKGTQLAANEKVIEACIAYEQATGNELDLPGILLELVKEGELVVSSTVAEDADARESSVGFEGFSEEVFTEFARGNFCNKTGDKETLFCEVMSDLDM